MGEITTVNNAGGKNYFAQIANDSSDSEEEDTKVEEPSKEDSLEETTDAIVEDKKKPLKKNDNVIQPSLKNEQKKIIKLKMKHGKKKKKGKAKGRAKYEEQFARQEGNLFEGIYELNLTKRRDS
jgi:hypothetical protein